MKFDIVVKMSFDKDNNFFLDKVASGLLLIFISMVFKEFGGVRLFPFSEYVALG